MSVQETFPCVDCKKPTTFADTLCIECVNEWPEDQRWRAYCPRGRCGVCNVNMQGSGSQLCQRCFHAPIQTSEVCDSSLVVDVSEIGDVST